MWSEGCAIADRGMERWQNHYGNVLSVALFLPLSSKTKKSEPADCCFSGCSDSHRRHADSDWHPGYFHKWIELSQMICHSSSRSLTALVLVWFCVSAHGLDTHTRNYARPNCHLPPRLSGSSQPRSPCSASWGVFAGWGRGLSDRLLLPQKGTGWSRTWHQQVPAGPSWCHLPDPDQRFTAGLLACHRQAPVVPTHG